MFLKSLTICCYGKVNITYVLNFYIIPYILVEKPLWFDSCDELVVCVLVVSLRICESNEFEV